MPLVGFRFKANGVVDGYRGREDERDVTPVEIIANHTRVLGPLHESPHRLLEGNLRDGSHTVPDFHIAHALHQLIEQASSPGAPGMTRSPRTITARS